MHPEKTGNLISELRKNKNLTQQELADQIGVTRKAISRWETGRGYPDIEILPKLADALSITINELVNGEVIPTENIAHTSNESLTYMCENVARINKQKRILIILLCILVSIISICIGIYMYHAICSYVDLLIGSENCVVARDYSYIMYYDEKYVPLDTKGYECRIGERIIDEAKLEGADPFSKLLFGEQVYAIDGVSDSVMIYLFTDYDYNPSDYYVKESELEYMESIVANYSEEYVCAEITQRNWEIKDITLEGDYLEMMESLNTALQDENENCNWARSDGEEGIPIVTYEANKIFFKRNGELIFKNDKYYWYDYNDHPYPATVAHATNPYLIDERYYQILEKLFSYMFE